jgi:hypothetical protein
VACCNSRCAACRHRPGHPQFRHQHQGRAPSPDRKPEAERTFFLAEFATFADPTSRSYCDRKRAEVRKRNAALICLVRRRCDVLYAMLRNVASPAPLSLARVTIHVTNPHLCSCQARWITIEPNADTIGASASAAFGEIRWSANGSAADFAEALVHEMQQKEASTIISSGGCHGLR